MSDGISVVSLLGVVFVTLKLLNIITWSWVWVTAPFWGPLVVAACILVLILLVGARPRRRVR